MGLPGGFWTQFIVVMAVIFILGFFLDFIEIAVVVVPIVAPILLMDPSANITAVWLGVMIGLNIQTSFLTPPFGFALFYLRGVASKIVKTVEIYRGVVPFIFLQLVGLGIVGYMPSLVNYLPARIYLTSESSPPPMNPKLQECLESYVFDRYATEDQALLGVADEIERLRMDYLPDSVSTKLDSVASSIRSTFPLIEEVKLAHTAKAEFERGYRALHKKVRFVQKQSKRVDLRIEDVDQAIVRLDRGEESDLSRDELVRSRELLFAQRQEIGSKIPSEWQAQNEAYLALLKDDKKKVNQYRRNVDDGYMALVEVRRLIADTPALIDIGPELDRLYAALQILEPDEAQSQIKKLRSVLGQVDGTSKIKSKLNKSRKAFKGNNPDREKGLAEMGKAIDLYLAEVSWRKQAFSELTESLYRIDEALSPTIGLRQQAQMTEEQALYAASCRAGHKDVSLNF